MLRAPRAFTTATAPRAAAVASHEELPGASHNLRARRPPEGVNEVWMAREVAEAREKAVVVVTCGREVHRERAAEDLQNNAAASPNLKLVRKRLVGRTSRRGGGIPEPPDFLIEKSASRSSRAGRGRSGSAPERGERPCCCPEPLLYRSYNFRFWQGIQELMRFWRL